MRATSTLINITDREMEVLCFISKEFTASEIAQQLYLSRHTVISHRKNLLEKLKARNGAGLVRRAFELGILKVGQATS